MSALGTGVAHLNSSGTLSSGLITNSDLTNTSYSNITGVGTLTSGALGTGFTTVGVAQGGTGVSSTTVDGILAGGATATGAFQNVGTGAAGQALVSNGPGQLPTWSSSSCLQCLEEVPPTTAQNTISPTAAGVVGLTVQETSSATGADILDLQSSTGTNLVTVDHSGALTLAGLNSSGVVHTNGSGTLSTSLITNNDLQTGSFTHITTVGTLTGLAVTGTTNLTGATTVNGGGAGIVPLSITNSSSPTADYLDVSSSGGTAGDIFNIAGNGDINASGQIRGLTGLSTLGAVTLSALSSNGVVHTNTSGGLSTSLITNADLAGGAYNAISGVGTLTGLNVGGNQTISNSGTLTISALSTGIAHVNSSGTLSSSLITNTDLAGGSYSAITSVGTLTGLGVTGATTLTADAATTTPLSIVGAAGQSHDFLDITSNGGAAGNILKVSSAGVLTADGGGLTNLNASNIASGTLNDARLSTNVALLNANNAFTGSNSFSADTTFGTGLSTGTAVLVNTAGGYSGDLLDLQVAGSSVLHVDQAGNLNFAGTATGNGSGLTTLNATNFFSGTVANARLSGAYTGVTGLGTLTALNVGGNETISNSGTLTISALGTGIAHVNSSGTLSSSLIVNADLNGGSYSAITGLGTLTGLNVSGGTTLTGTTTNNGATTLNGNAAGNVPLSITNAASPTADYWTSPAMAAAPRATSSPSTTPAM